MADLRTYEWIQNLKRVDGDGHIPQMSTSDVILPMKEQNHLFRGKKSDANLLLRGKWSDLSHRRNAQGTKPTTIVLTFVCLP